MNRSTSDEHATGSLSARPAARAHRRRLIQLVLGELVAVIVLATLSQQISAYYEYIFVYAGIYAIAVLGNNLLLSHVGQLSIGQGGLVAIGAYATILACRAGWSTVEAIVIGTLAAAVAGFIVGLPAVRLASQYLALVTLAFALAVSEILSAWGAVTGGSNGLSVDAHFVAPGSLYIVTFVVLGVALVTQELLLAGPIGQTLHMIRDSPRAATAFGIRNSAYKLGAFTYSGALAGLSGALLVSLVTYVSPDQFTFDLSIYILAAVVMAGMNWPLAALAGGMVIGAVPQLTTTSAGAAPVILGGVLIVAVLAQQLLYSRLARLAARVRRGGRDPSSDLVAAARHDEATRSSA